QRGPPLLELALPLLSGEPVDGRRDGDVAVETPLGGLVRRDADLFDVASRPPEVSGVSVRPGADGEPEVHLIPRPEVDDLSLESDPVAHGASVVDDPDTVPDLEGRGLSRFTFRPPPSRELDPGPSGARRPSVVETEG